MIEQAVLIESVRAMKNVVDGVRDEQWDMEMPSDFPTADPEAKKTLRGVINSIAYDIAWVPDMLTGRTMEETGKNKFDGDLLGDNPKGNFTALAAKATDAVQELTDLDGTVHCSYASYPARNYFVDISSYYGLSAYDIAKAISVDAILTPALVEGLWQHIEPVAEEWRAMGIFGPKVEVPADADLQSRLLALTGREA